MKTPAFLSALVVAASLLVGCSGPVFVARAVPVASVQTVPVEAVTKTTSTDAASGQTSVVFVTNTVSQLVTNWSTNVVYEVSETVTRSLAAVGAVNDTVNQIAPNPVSGVLNLGLGSATALLAWLARQKSRKAQTNADLLETVIAGVEDSNLPAVKERIAQIAKAWGTSADLAAAVKQQTKP